MRILVSRLQFIGDIVLTTPVIEALRGRFPDAEIDYLGEREAVTLLERNPHLNRTIPYDLGRLSVLEQVSVGSALRRNRYDVAIDLFGNPRSAVVIWMSRAPVRIGGAFGWRAKTYTHPILITERMTAVRFHLRYLEPLGIHEGSGLPRIYLSETEGEDARKYLESLNVDVSKNLVGLHIGATWPAKVWQQTGFSRLATQIVEETGSEVVVTYGPADTGYLRTFSELTRSRFTAVPPQRLRRFASVLSQMDAFVSNDAAPMHISAAVGTPTVGVFGPGEPDIWFPYDAASGHSFLKKEVGCCRSDVCRLKGGEYMKCMSAIGPAEVLTSVKVALKIRKREVR